MRIMVGGTRSWQWLRNRIVQARQAAIEEWMRDNGGTRLMQSEATRKVKIMEMESGKYDSIATLWVCYDIGQENQT